MNVNEVLRKENWHFSDLERNQLIRGKVAANFASSHEITFLVSFFGALVSETSVPTIRMYTRPFY